MVILGEVELVVMMEDGEAVVVDKEEVNLSGRVFWPGEPYLGKHFTCTE